MTLKLKRSAAKDTVFHIRRHLLNLPYRAALAWYSIPRYFLARWHGCGPFHITPLRYKRYCLDIIAYLNSRPQRGSILEIGCGFGDILLNVDFRERTGLDHKQNVLDALRFLDRLRFWSRRPLTTGLLRFGQDAVSGTYDYVVLCNWIHNIDPRTLRANIETLFRDNLNPGGEIVFDTVTGDHYPHHHDPVFLAERIVAHISTIGIYAGGHITGNGTRQVISFLKPA